MRIEGWPTSSAAFQGACCPAGWTAAAYSPFFCEQFLYNPCQVPASLPATPAQGNTASAAIAHTPRQPRRRHPEPSVCKFHDKLFDARAPLKATGPAVFDAQLRPRQSLASLLIDASVAVAVHAARHGIPAAIRRVPAAAPAAILPRGSAQPETAASPLRRPLRPATIRLWL